MKLVDVYEERNRAGLLYQLLAERDDTINIDHQGLPAWEDHVRFIRSKPYAAWYFLDVEGVVVGSVYLTKRDEIGVFIFKKYQGHGHGKEAVKLLMEKLAPRTFKANINPKNEKSKSLFTGLGFGLITETYAKHG